ncbi:hypothetical protein B0H67DRAFT_644875 [Lasiosphaeris hirsuta]|uniref:Uncharacterized protein n=1 Tax=Lasiosphaeris hirsuta TaxID=260670 RepID=A0AA40DTN0_9PEZI|nr:hypothetical protein B0H67DRAFT_644875 [Lasiosphaeris hirsuta]
MPSTLQLFPKRRETTPDYPRDTNPSRTKGPRRKLKKQPPFQYLKTNTVAIDLSILVMGHNMSTFENIPRPTRPPRPSATELPDLPSLPIYQAFTARHHPAAILEGENIPPIPEKSSSRRSSISDWPRQRCDSTSRGREPERCEKPRYDRASHLAESYRAILPDMESMTRSPTLSEPLQPSSLPASPMLSRSNSIRIATPFPPLAAGRRHYSPAPRTPQRQRQQPPPRLGDRPLHDPFLSASPSVTPLVPLTPTTPPWQHARPVRAAKPETRPYTSWLPPHPHSCPGAARSTSTISSSSATAVELSDMPHSPAGTSDGHENDGNDVSRWTMPETSPSTCRRWSLDSESGASEAPSPRAAVRGLQRSRRTSDDVGLQICSDLLVDELAKVFYGGEGRGKRHSSYGSQGPAGDGGERAKKLQLLLLIEAYEATLETCRREVSWPPVVRGTGGDRTRRKHVREVVGILDHWLGSLYSIYDEEFAGEEEGSKGFPVHI